MQEKLISLGLVLLLFQGSMSAEQKLTRKDSGAEFLGKVDNSGNVFVTCGGDNLPIHEGDRVEPTDIKCDGTKGGGINPYGYEAPDRPQTPPDKPNAGSPPGTGVRI